MNGTRQSGLKNAKGKSAGPTHVQPPAQPPKLVYILYQDHVLFRNTDPNLYKPSLRECVGWIEKEDEKAIWVVWERSVKPFPHGITQPSESGLVILKSDIVELREVQLA